MQRRINRTAAPQTLPAVGRRIDTGLRLGTAELLGGEFETIYYVIDPGPLE